VELRDYVFSKSSGVSITWHRVREFQRLTLQLVAERILANSPHYQERSTDHPHHRFYYYFYYHCCCCYYFYFFYCDYDFY